MAAECDGEKPWETRAAVAFLVTCVVSWVVEDRRGVENAREEIFCAVQLSKHALQSETVAAVRAGLRHNTISSLCSQPTTQANRYRFCFRTSNKQQEFITTLLFLQQ